jgi:hypothetical protein
MPIIGLWLPSVLNLGMAKNPIPEANLCMSDIYVCRHEDYSFLKSDIADQEDDVIAVIRKRQFRNGANCSLIHFRGGHLVTACRSIEGHYQCTWEDASRGLLTMKSCITEGGGSEGSPFEISDCTGVKTTVGCMDERIISLYRHKECLPSGNDLHSTFNVDIILIFAAWITMDKADIK